MFDVLSQRRPALCTRYSIAGRTAFEGVKSKMREENDGSGAGKRLTANKEINNK